MKRTKFKRADAILTGDWHLREDQPVCRTDDFQQVLWEKVDFIADLQTQHQCPVLHSGDLFHHWKPSPYLLSKTMKHLPARFYTIYGNHDLPQHNLDLVEKCGIHALETANKLTVLDGTHWGEELQEHTLLLTGADRTLKIALWHVMTYAGQKPWPDCPDPDCNRLLKKYKDFDLILTGHNHKTFVAKHNNRLLVNPGSISRQEAGQIDHDPSVFLYYAETNSVEQVFLPIPVGVITREHIQGTEERDRRISAFISRLNNDFSAEVSFENNLEKLISSNQLRKSVVEIIRKATD